MHAVFEAWSR